MAKVTSKLQVTIPKAVAERYGIEPGDTIEFVPSGDGIRVETTRSPPLATHLGLADRLALFDEATERQRKRQERRRRRHPTTGRGWSREELYERARPR